MISSLKRIIEFLTILATLKTRSSVAEVRKGLILILLLLMTGVLPLSCTSGGISSGGGGDSASPGNAVSGQVNPFSQSNTGIDTISPTVVATIPANGEDWFNRSTVTALFSEPIDPASLTTNAFTVFQGNQPVPGEILMTMAIGDPRGVAAATFRPSGNLASRTQYTAVAASSIKDLAGNPMAADYIWSFTTGYVQDQVPPAVYSVTPSTDAKDVPINISIQVTFDEIMDLGSIRKGSFFILSGGQKLEGTLSFAVDPVVRGSVVNFVPQDPLQLGSDYTVYITRAVMDAEGNPMVADYSSSFTTTLSAESGGFAFSQPIKLRASTSFSSVPILKVDPAGKVYVFWGGPSIQMSRSIDGGGTFSSMQAIVPNQEIGSATIQNNMIDLGSAYNISQLINGTYYIHPEISYTRSIDGGDTFSAPVNISAVDDISSSESAITRKKDLVGIVWDDYIFQFQYAGFSVSKPAVLFSRSVDGGDTFSVPVAISGPQATYGYPQIAIADSGNIYVIWHDDDQFTTILFTRSTDGGVSFSAPIRISNPQQMMSIWLTQIVLELNGNIDIIWQEGSTIYLARSTDQGLTFNLSGSYALPSGNVICPSANVTPSGEIVVSWSVGDVLNGPATSYFAYAMSDLVFSAPVQIPVMNSMSGCPQIVIDPNSSNIFHVLWNVYYSKVTPDPVSP